MRKRVWAPPQASEVGGSAGRVRKKGHAVGLHRDSSAPSPSRPWSPFPHSAATRRRAGLPESAPTAAVSDENHRGRGHRLARHIAVPRWSSGVVASLAVSDSPRRRPDYLLLAYCRRFRLLPVRRPVHQFIYEKNEHLFIFLNLTLTSNEYT